MSIMKNKLFMVLLFCNFVPAVFAQESLKSVCLYWDVSMSMENRDITSDLNFLDAYFKNENCDLTLKIFNTEFLQEETFAVRKGEWSSLRTLLLNITYDGMTSYRPLFKETNYFDSYLLLSDAGTCFDPLEVPSNVDVTIVNSKEEEQVKEFGTNVTYTNIHNPNHSVAEKKLRVEGTTAVQRIAGNVRDDLGPLIGVNVIIQGANRGTTTDDSGDYTLEAKTGDVVLFSYLGKKAVLINVIDNTTINVVMNESNEGLEEVLVTTKKEEEDFINTAYGKKNKKAIGYDIQTLDQDQLSKTATNINQSIQGKLTGMGHTTNTDLSKFTVRSLQTILGDVYGLIVIDGVPQAKASSSSGTTIGGSPANFSWLNPNDIADITLLKSMAATNKYGTLGVNGVLEITTINGMNKRKGDPKDPVIGTTATYTEDTKMIDNLPATPYIKALQAAKTLDDAYAIYLEQRDRYYSRFEFFIDVYDYFKGWNNYTISNRILESAIDLNYDDIAILKAVGYKYQEHNEHEKALRVFRYIAKIAPKKSQSHRDVALAYHFAGNHKAAYKIYDEIIRNRNASGANFIGLMPTIEAEYKNIISKYRSILEVSNTPPAYLVKSPLDYRIVFEWNDLAAEFDMQIVNPQKRFFTISHTKSNDPQRMRQEKAQGYGLEENFLTRDDKGEWLFNIDYKGTKKDSGPIYIKMTLFENYGKPNETKKINVFRFIDRGDKVTVAKIII
jgi:tetratricopeptide (TPR) repeat protein